MHLIENEMKSAQHLLYVSLKYTKTCDVILNLIHRWQQMIELGIEYLLNKAKKQRLIKQIPHAPKQKVDTLLGIFKKEPLVVSTLEDYTFFRKIPSLKLIREHEFRKNVTLTVVDGSKEVAINMEKLKEWQAKFEAFVAFVRTYISKR
jgi:hypothetical protein